MPSAPASSATSPHGFTAGATSVLAGDAAGSLVCLCSNELVVWCVSAQPKYAKSTTRMTAPTLASASITGPFDSARVSRPEAVAAKVMAPPAAAATSAASVVPYHPIATAEGRLPYSQDRSSGRYQSSGDFDAVTTR